jgi:hypothetical protein
MEYANLTLYSKASQPLPALQELIAPDRVIFFDSTWSERGEKSDLTVLLMKITGIQKPILTLDYQYVDEKLSKLSVSTKMHWASKRHTTRAEDVAYCLLGIFDVHMPLLYGEGPHAFQRLQEEIAKKSSDLSLLAWTADRRSSRYTSVFARSVSHFETPDEMFPFRTDFSVTNMGLKFSAAPLASNSSMPDHHCKPFAISFIWGPQNLSLDLPKGSL